MRRLTFRLLVALLTFTIGVAAASLWFINHLSPSSDIEPLMKAEDHQPVPIPAKPKTVTDDRDLSLYDFGGRQGCGIVLTVTKASRCDASMKRARTFIWEHWQEKKRGYVIVRMASVDAESDAHIFVEPDDNGAWHVVWKWERIFAALIKDVSGRIDEIPDIRSVERRHATDKDYMYKAGTSYLLFLGKDGEEVQSL